MKKVMLIANMDEVIYLFRRQLVTALVRAGYRVIAVAPEGPYTGELIRAGAERITFPLSRHGMNPLSEVRLLARYFKVIKETAPDAVLTYTVKPNCYAGLVCRMLGIPFAANVTGIGEAFQKRGAAHFFASRLLQASLGGAAAVFFQNSSNMETFLRAGIVRQEQCILLPGSGVDLEQNKVRSYPETGGPLRFGMAARFCRSKGVVEYFAAARRFHSAYPGVGEFHFAGMTDDSALLKELDDGSVIMHGPIPASAMPEYFAGLDALVHPSYHEGLSNVVLEALACGRPVLVSDIPGCRECCGNDSGILFPAGSEEALFRAMEIFLGKSRRERAAMGKRGRSFVEKNFSRRKVTEAYMDLLSRILA